MKKENIYILIAIIFVVSAIASPILILFVSENQIGTETLNQMNDLGAVGDYIGGTTIALFNIASFSMLVAALVMQKEELKLQREEITKTREEYELTNKTMKKQQFESTFFNMISLHQSISKDITDKEKVFENFFGNFKKEYDKKFKEYTNDQFLAKLFSTYKDKESLEEMLEMIYMGLELKNYIENDYFLLTGDSRSESYKKEVREWLQKSDERLREEFRKKNQDPNLRSKMIEKIDYHKLKGTEIYIPNVFVIRQRTVIEELEKTTEHALKVKAYEKTYLKYERVIGHYFRNLYRIEKLLSEQGFSFEDRNNYRRIWRAQLSSFELTMLYYNINFSEKGFKFKNLLLNTGFFDDHIKRDDLIWNNDQELLADFRKGT